MTQTSTDRFVNYWFEAGVAAAHTEIQHEYRCEAATEINDSRDEYAFTLHHRKDGSAIRVDLEGLAWDLERDDAADLISERQHDGLSRQVARGM
jgi:hypothetical protein